ncbi:MAG: hypothetical protein DHS20C08_12430 [Rhodomicrobium sp.]|nr:MAG: hypothetical protein DHS20C08_12430 [Rhodomicrobium sp.]
MSKPKQGNKSKNRRSSARLAAVQALYQMDVAQTDLNEVLAEFISFRLGQEMEGDHMNKADITFFTDLLSGIVHQQRRLDPLIDKHLAASWRLNRIDSTLRAILRGGAYELTERSDVPHKVVISEYVDVAHAFFENDEPKVVNAVLQNLWRAQSSAPAQPAETEPVPIVAEAPEVIVTPEQQTTNELAPEPTAADETKADLAETPINHPVEEKGGA